MRRFLSDIFSNNKRFADRLEFLLGNKMINSETIMDTFENSELWGGIKIPTMVGFILDDNGFRIFHKDCTLLEDVPHFEYIAFGGTGKDFLEHFIHLDAGNDLNPDIGGTEILSTFGKALRIVLQIVATLISQDTYHEGASLKKGFGARAYL